MVKCVMFGLPQPPNTTVSLLESGSHSRWFGEAGLTLAVVDGLCRQLVLGPVRLDGVWHLGGVWGQRDPLQGHVVSFNTFRN